jgi:hypothetical protein
MTLTEARRLAKQARRYGYLTGNQVPGQLHGNTLTVTCPVCRERVSVEFSQYFHGGSVVRTLDAAVIEHLRDGDECGGAS